MGTELAGGPTGRIHLLRADIVGAIGQSVFRFDALCRPGSDLSAKPEVHPGYVLPVPVLTQFSQVWVEAESANST